MSDWETTAEPYLPEPPPEPPELPWTDWSVPAFVSVSARTAEEAQRHIEWVIAYVNGLLEDIVFKPIVQRANDDLPREA